MRKTMVVLLILVAFLLAACGAQPTPTAAPTEPTAGMPNPASQFCVDRGYQLEIRSEAGGEVGYCLFPDGSECEEWAFYRGQCAPKAGGAEGTAQPTPAQIANPASQNCIKQGGTLSIQTRGDGGQVGICLFEDNRQCEEWALLHGDCPVGGIKVTGYVTPAAQYCAITGGQYAVTGNNNTENEQGTCTFKDGSQCDAWAYYDGKCTPGSAGAVPATAEPAAPTPSGGGAGQIVFSSNRGGEYSDLYVMDLDGSDLVRLTQGDANSFAGPWSPDGTRIVYTAFGLVHSYVAVINAAPLEGGTGGTGRASLTSNPNADDAFPAWSPDGSRIAFTSNRDGNNEIYAMDADGANPIRLTDDPADDFAPAWSPDGARIAFVSDRGRETGIYDLYIMNADGSGVTRLTNDEAIDYAPDWSPDGSKIAFRSHHGGPGDVWVINVDATGLTNLTDNPAEDWTPTWSPDGTLIAFQTNRDGNWEIYTMDANGGGLVNVTNHPADDQMPYWRPAGVAATGVHLAGTVAHVPLHEALGSLEPRDVWQSFYDVTQVPRSSEHEEQVREFLVQFGQALGLETVVDEAGNVIIRKPAAPGMETRKGVILQAHMDMVAQKAPDKVHDFATDPISAYVDGEWVRADGTTLGADDGIGLAMAMAVLQSQTLAAGPIEALFTVDEEGGVTGASGLKPGVLQGDILINVDSETEGAFTIGSAGGEDAKVHTTYAQTAAPDGMAAYQVTVQGLTGGHSGVDIDKGRGHATKLLVRLLRGAATAYGVRVAELSGGTADNAIPREATALVCLPEAQSDAFLAYVAAFEATVRGELAAVEPGLSVVAEPTVRPAQVMDEQAQSRVIDALYATPQGVLRMSDAVPGLVETSTNVGIVQAADGKLDVICLSRSSVVTALDDAGAMIASVWQLAGAKVELTGRYPGWRPNPDSAILALMQAAYQDLYGRQAEVVALHAGLETSVIGAAYPNLDMISIGPTLVDVHTPDERLEIASVQKVWDLLLATLQAIPTR